MVKHTIYFQDLTEDNQNELWEEVQQMIIEECWVVQGEDEPDEWYLQRVWEATDTYIKTHNLAQEYEL